MSIATATPTKTDILRAIGKYWAENYSWPEKSDITRELGPIPGLLSIVADFHANKLLEVNQVGSIFQLELLLPPSEVNWHHSHQNVISLGDWLVNEQQYDGDQLQKYYAKHWNYGQEYAVYLAVS